MDKNLFVIVGPTAIGKSDISIKIAKELNTCIINADSRQIYKEMSIGTAAPTENQLKSVKHYLVQHKSIHDYYNAFIFEEESLNIINNVLKTNKDIILAGGSGMYVDAICKGIDNIPTVDPDLRIFLDKKFSYEGIESMRIMLKNIDRKYYNSVDLANPKRIMKGIEVSVQTGKPYSSFLTDKSKNRPFNIIKIGLFDDKPIINSRINERVDLMVDEGLFDEARDLFKYRDLNALNTVGYKEIFMHFDGKISREEAIELIKKDTRNFAKRQLTWFRRDKKTNWFSINDLSKIYTFVDKNRYHEN